MELDKIYCGDCLDVMKGFDDNSFDLCLTDPPYGTTACKWDTIIPLEPMWKQLKRIVKNNGAIVMTASQPFTTTLIASNMKMFKYCWVWDKKLPSGALNANRIPMKVHEDITVFYQKAPTYNPAMRIGAMRVKGGGKPSQCYGKVVPTQSVNNQYYPTSIIEISNGNRNDRVHPTQKPIALMQYLIKTYTNEGESVLDFTCGSGTTGVACVRMGRKFVGIEKIPGYCAIAEKRIQDERDKYALLP